MRKAKTALGLAIAFLAATVLVTMVAALSQLHGRAAATAPSPHALEQTADTSGFPQVDWAYWQSINPDVIGWITVPGTPIDYPIVQARPNDSSYYLDHDVYGQWNYMGCPYLDAACVDAGLLGSPNAVIFGHNLGYGDTSLFAAFASYSDEAFAKEHAAILIQTSTEKRRIDTFASACIEGQSALKRTNFENAHDFANYREQLYDSATVKLANSNSAAPSMFTFVTCSYNYWDNERTLVFAQETDPREELTMHQMAAIAND